MSKILKSATHDATLVNRISALAVDGQSKFSDVTVLVGTKTFQCHKLILALASNYFEQKLFGTGSSPVASQIRVDVVQPDDFQNALRYIYKGEVSLSEQNVENMFKAAVALELTELRQVCASYMMETLGSNNCGQFWNLAEAENEAKISSACKQIFSREVDKLPSSQLQCMTEGMMKEVLGCDDLWIDGEVDVCEILLKWLDQQTQAGKTVQLYPLLTAIRWSGVPVEYTRSKLLANSTLQGDQRSVEFLSKVVNYQLAGVQSEDICTFHRESTELVQSVIIVGLNAGDLITSSDVYRFSLQHTETVRKLPDIPTNNATEAAACIMNDKLYVTGVGSSLTQTWMWNTITGWSRCGDLVTGRRRHAIGVVASSDLYVVGGYVKSPKTALTSIEKYKPLVNKWKEAGNLVQGTMNAACAAVGTSIYLFGGIGIDAKKHYESDLDCVQVYDTITKSCTVLTQRLPTAQRLLRAVLWDKSVVLMNNSTCLVFDIGQQTFQQRNQFAAGIDHFGLVLDNQMIYIIGGGNNTEKDDETIWKCTDDVKRVPVMDIMNNKSTVSWVHHAKLPQPSLVHAFALVTLPTA